MTTTALTVREASDLAQGLTGDNLEAAVAAIPADLVPVYLARLVDAATNIRALTKGLEQRLVADGLTGQHFTVDATEYGFFGSLQRGFRDIPTLLINLGALGISLSGVAEAVSDMRVTTLRELAAGLRDQEKREWALNLIEQHRVEKGERGAPRFQVVDEKYVKPAITAK